MNKKIKNYSLYSLGVNSIRNLKLFGNLCRLLAPYVLSAGIATSGFHFVFGGFPFVKDYVKKDAGSSSKKCSQTVDFDNQNEFVGCLYFYGKCYKQNGHYYRLVTGYNLSDVNEDNIMDICSNKTLSQLGQPIFSHLEHSEKFDNEDEYFEVLYYDKNKEDYIILEESNLENILESIGYMQFLSLLEFIALIYRHFVKYRYYDEKDGINKEYDKILNKDGLNKYCKKLTK